MCKFICNILHFALIFWTVTCGTFSIFGYYLLFLFFAVRGVSSIDPAFYAETDSLGGLCSLCEIVSRAFPPE
jgi:hypothetical protein